jgi:type I restriction enzyme S subunit
MAHFFGPYAMRNTVKATVDSLRLPTFQNFTFFAPANVCEQTAIATILSDMDAEITALERRRDKTKMIKQGMMQQLLTGRIRLINPSEEEMEPA